MRTPLSLVPLVLIPLLSGCSMTPGPVSEPSPAQLIPKPDQSQDSLFSTDAEVLSDAAIARILEFEWRSPPRARIAILPFGSESWFGWSEELNEAASAMQDRLADRLGGSTGVAHVAYLPSVLTPRERTVARLREAAARYQADLMLVYRTQCHSFDKYRFLRNSQSRARCTVDALLLDTRTGLVPFSLAQSESFDATRSGEDLNFRETVLRAHLQATGSALDSIAVQVVSFLDRGQHGQP